MSNTTTGFRITVSGYSHKLLTLLNEVLEKVVAFEVLDDRFEVCPNRSLPGIALGLKISLSGCSAVALHLIAMRLLSDSVMPCHFSVTHAHVHTHVRLQSWPVPLKGLGSLKA